MPDYGSLRKGQEVFIKRPIQIYANVVGQTEVEMTPQSATYCVQLQPLKQYYRAEDLEPSEKPELIPAGQLNYFDRAREIMERINRRAYELFESSGYTHGHDREDWHRAQSEILIDVPVDVRETDTEVTIHAEVPGVSEEHLELQLAPRLLCITGKRHLGSEPATANPAYSERRCGEIFRVLNLPSDVDPGKVGVTLSSGILEIRVAKAAADQGASLRSRTASA